MRVKRYVVDSMPDALQKIRSDLGKDAVIINTKEVRSGGFLGLFGKKKIEVIAAIDAQPQAGSARGQAKPAQARPAAPPKPVRPQHVAVPDEPMPFVPDVLAGGEPELPPAESPQPSARSAAEKQAAEKAAEKAPEKAKEDKLLDEIQQMKQMMVRLSAKTHDAGAERNPLLLELENRLEQQEIAVDLVEQIIGRIEADALGSDAELTAEVVHQAAGEQLASLLTREGEKRIARDTRIVHFVGPTGVGKTTTIAKLAAEQVLKHQRKVGFITSDTYRIAAVEQLKTYANILNVPLEVVFSPQDLKKAFNQLESCDMIFMDTAGRNFRNEMYVSELNSLLQAKGRSETILVLSLTAKYKDMKVITENFMKFKLDKVLFTKRDETDTFGAVVNLMSEFPLSLSYITNGQNVPEDIIPLDEQRLVDLILGGKADE